MRTKACGSIRTVPLMSWYILRAPALLLLGLAAGYYLRLTISDFWRLQKYESVTKKETRISGPSKHQELLPTSELATTKETERPVSSEHQQSLQNSEPVMPVANSEMGRELVQNHVYEHEMARGNRSCEAFRQDEELLKSGWNYTRYPWRIVRHGARTARSEVLYGTSLAQKMIWEHQHPEDCSKAKFLEFYDQASGIGSQLHVLGQALAVAMHLGRVLVIPQKKYQYYDASFCPGEVGWQCWFQRLTWCRSQGDVKSMGFPPAAPGFPTQKVPEVFHELLSSCSPVKKRFWHYWWRAQSVTYLIRFNQQTRSALDVMRKDTLFDCRGKVAEDILEPGTVSAHVRHGAKGREAEVFPFAKYLQSAQHLADGNQSLRILSYQPAAQSNNSFTYPMDYYAKKSLFLSTEDPGVVVEAVKRCHANPSWKLVYTKVTRSNNDPWMRLYSPVMARREVLVAMMNLELALEADAWVCSLTSNWCRLIDELRDTIGLKASLPYINLGYGTRNCGKEKPECYIDWWNRGG